MVRFVVMVSIRQCSLAAFFVLVSANSFANDDISNIYCGKLLNVENGRVLEDILINIDTKSEKIISVVKANSRDISKTTLNLSDHFCLPGLIDMHTHISEKSSAVMSDFLNRSQDQQLAIARVNAAITLQAGFTSIRDLGVYIAWTDKRLRDEINQGLTKGPRIQVSGYYLTIPGGGGDIDIPGYSGEVPDHIRLGVTKGVDEFRQRAENAVAGGADLLKMIASGAVLAYGSLPGSPEMNQDEITAVVEVGHQSGVKVTAHAHGAESIKQAILAGVDSIEHASLIDNEGINLAKAEGVALSMDIYNGDYINTVGAAENWPEEFLRKNRETTDLQRENFTKAHKAGVIIVYGTDAGVYPHGDNAKQFAYMVDWGMTNLEAIQSATIAAAKVMGWEDQVGIIKQGYFADLVAVRDNPLLNIQALENIDVVIKGGKLYQNN
jgi:imidazolonepropionase-like amidohydrolase